MKRDEYEKMYTLEATYWWFRGKRDLIDAYFKKYMKAPRPKIIDLGCGTGIMMKHFSSRADVHGVDFSEDAISFCKMRGLQNLHHGSIQKIPYPDHSFDAAFCLDVLYHKGVDDVAALDEIWRILKPGGKLFITDSAMPILWSKHDIASHAARRYTKKHLGTKLKNAHFSIDKMTYFNTFLFPAILVARKIGNRLPGEASTDISPLPKPINKMLLGLYRTEISLMNYIPFPFGVSIFCVAKKENK